MSTEFSFKKHRVFREKDEEHEDGIWKKLPELFEKDMQ